MSYIILFPAANNVVQHTPFPAAGQNFNVVSNYPIEPEDFSYVENAAAPGTHQDSYTRAPLLVLNLDINSIEVIVSAKRSGAAAGAYTCSPLYIAGGITTYSPAPLLVPYTSYSWLSYQFLLNPVTGKKWNITTANLITAFGFKNITTAANTIKINNAYLKINVSVLGEYVSNFSPYLNDTIQPNQDFSIIADSPGSRNLLRCTDPKIFYKLPSGVESSLDASIIDETKLIAKMPAATNTMAGKIMFKLICTLPSGQILEGNPFFTNVISRWV